MQVGALLEPVATTRPTFLSVVPFRPASPPQGATMLPSIDMKQAGAKKRRDRLHLRLCHGNHDAAIFYTEVIDLFLSTSKGKPRVENVRRGAYWWGRSAADWAQRLGHTLDHVEYLLKRLRGWNLILTCKAKTPVNMLQIRPVVAAGAALLAGVPDESNYTEVLEAGSHTAQGSAGEKCRIAMEQKLPDSYPGKTTGTSIKDLTVVEVSTVLKTDNQASKLAQGKHVPHFPVSTGESKTPEKNRKKSENKSKTEKNQTKIEQMHYQQTIKTSAEFVKSAILGETLVDTNYETGAGADMKAHEVAAKFKNKTTAATPKVVGAKYLELVWKKAMAELSPGFVKDLTQKELGQLKLYLQKVGPERATWALQFALENWNTFAWEVRKAKGKSLVPEVPQVGFLLEHHDTLLQLIAQKDSTHAAVKTTMTPKPLSGGHETPVVSPSIPTAAAPTPVSEADKAEQHALYLQALEKLTKGHNKE